MGKHWTEPHSSCGCHHGPKVDERTFFDDKSEYDTEEEDEENLDKENGEKDEDQEKNSSDSSDDSDMELDVWKTDPKFIQRVRKLESKWKDMEYEMNLNSKSTSNRFKRLSRKLTQGALEHPQTLRVISALALLGGFLVTLIIRTNAGEPSQ